MGTAFDFDGVLASAQADARRFDGVDDAACDRVYDAIEAAQDAWDAAARRQRTAALQAASRAAALDPRWVPFVESLRGTPRTPARPHGWPEFARAQDGSRPAPGWRVVGWWTFDLVRGSIAEGKYGTVHDVEGCAARGDLLVRDASLPWADGSDPSGHTGVAVGASRRDATPVPGGGLHYPAEVQTLQRALARAGRREVLQTWCGRATIVEIVEDEQVAALLARLRDLPLG